MNNEIIKRYSFKELPIEIEVKDLEFVKRMSPILRYHHRSEFYQIIWISQGEMNLLVDFEEVILKAGEILVIAMGKVCQFSSATTYSGYSILFTPLFFSESNSDSEILHKSKIFSPIFGTECINIEFELVSSLIKMLRDELDRANDQFQATIARSYLRILLSEIERNVTVGNIYNRDDATTIFCKEVELRFRELHNVNDYLEITGLQDRVITKSLREALGVTPKGYIDQRIMLEAKRLVAYSNLPIKEIGFSLGFDEPTNFNKFFRKHIGISPKEFKCLLQKQ